MVYLLGSAKTRGHSGLLTIVCLITAGWYAATAIGFYSADFSYGWAFIGETFRSLAWSLFLLALMSRLLGAEDRNAVPLGLWVLLVLAVAASAYLLLADGTRLWDPGTRTEQYFVGDQWTFGARLLPVIAGLAMVENLYRNTHASDRWSVRPIALAVGGMFLFDLVLYSNAFLFRQIDITLFVARGAISVVLVPLIGVAAARNPTWKLHVFVSRRAVFRMVSVFGSGIYLILVAAIGYYLRVTGGQWGLLIQVTFVFAAGLILLLALTSGKFRSQVRVFFNKHFFRYNYDYREEWLRFIGTVSSTAHRGKLRERVVEAVCDIADSPGGVLWLFDEQEESYRPAERWNFKGHPSGVLEAGHPIVEYIQRTEWIIDMDDWRARDDAYEGIVPPEWVSEDERQWILLPLVHLERLPGFIVLERARAHRQLDWEDRDLLKTVGRQAASYLAEQKSEVALVEAQQFDRFNQQFAFVMHDVKNLVSQLSLVVKNAERHADNPEFQADMLETVRQSTEKMKLLLERMKGQADVDVMRAEDINLVRFLEAMAERFRKAGKQVDISTGMETIWVTGDRERLDVAIEHLVQNGFDAQGGEGEIRLALDTTEECVRLVIEDHGVGMSEQFIKDHLFKPFSSTKESGFGIGVFESRKIIQDHRGKIGVDSRQGEGTRMTVTLPLSRRTMSQSRLSRVAG